MTFLCQTSGPNAEHWVKDSHLHKLRLIVSFNQCDQMGRLFFDIWLFTTMKLCSIAFPCQNRFKILPNTKLSF